MTLITKTPLSRIYFGDPHTSLSAQQKDSNLKQAVTSALYFLEGLTPPKTVPELLDMVFDAKHYPDNQNAELFSIRTVFQSNPGVFKNNQQLSAWTQKFLVFLAVHHDPTLVSPTTGAVDYKKAIAALGTLSSNLHPNVFNPKAIQNMRFFPKQNVVFGKNRAVEVKDIKIDAAIMQKRTAENQERVKTLTMDFTKIPSKDPEINIEKQRQIAFGDGHCNGHLVLNMLVQTGVLKIKEGKAEQWRAMTQPIDEIGKTMLLYRKAEDDFFAQAQGGNPRYFLKNLPENKKMTEEQKEANTIKWKNQIAERTEAFPKTKPEGSEETWGEIMARFKTFSNNFPKNLAEVVEVTEEAQSKGAGEIVFLGDILADRGAGDHFMLDILNVLEEGKAQYKIVFSNHDLEFLKWHLSLQQQMGDEYVSLLNAEHLCDNFKETYKEKIQSAYLKKLDLFAFDKESRSFYCHAFVNKPLFNLLWEVMKANGDAKGSPPFEEKLDTINHWFRDTIVKNKEGRYTPYKDILARVLGLTGKIMQHDVNDIMTLIRSLAKNPPSENEVWALISGKTEDEINAIMKEKDQKTENEKEPFLVKQIFQTFDPPGPEVARVVHGHTQDLKHYSDEKLQKEAEYNPEEILFRENFITLDAYCGNQSWIDKMNDYKDLMEKHPEIKAPPELGDLTEKELKTMWVHIKGHQGNRESIESELKKKLKVENLFRSRKGRFGPSVDGLSKYLRF